MLIVFGRATVHAARDDLPAQRRKVRLQELAQALLEKVVKTLCSLIVCFLTNFWLSLYAQELVGDDATFHL
jgi:hypothetical protein